MTVKKAFCVLVLLICQALPSALDALEVIPPVEEIRAGRPRLFLRPGTTPHAVSLERIRGLEHDSGFSAMLAQLREQDNAAAQALVWLLTGDEAAAGRALERMLSYNVPEEYNTFHIHSRLTEFGMAYDWLCNWPGFTREVRSELRKKINPVAWRGFNNTNDHIFHNYVWMSGGGAIIWALATAGEDDEATVLLNQLREAFNSRLYPAWQYLDGLPSEPLGYWAYYVFAPGVLAILASQSAFESDITGRIEKEQGGWLRRHYRNMIHSVLPDMRFLPWGDLQSGSNGGVTIQFPGIMDGLALALDSPRGAWWSGWIADKRGLDRFYRWTAIWYFLFTRHLDAGPESPPLQFMAGGGSQGGHLIARSGWDDNATVFAFGVQDHYGDHHHYDQGGFIIYRNGLLAVDPPVYNKVAGPQQPTSVHNTLLIGGQVQRRARGQWFSTLEEFKENLDSGNRLETGDMLFYGHGDKWAAASGEFARAYPEGLVSSCIRQVLFIRPGRFIIVDHLRAPEGETVPPVEWLLQLPEKPATRERAVTSSNGRSWISCTSFAGSGNLTQEAGGPELTVDTTAVHTHRARFAYQAGGGSLVLCHALEVGDGTPAPSFGEIIFTRPENALMVEWSGTSYRFSLEGEHGVGPAIP